MTKQERKEMVELILRDFQSTDKTNAVLRTALLRLGDTELGVLYKRVEVLAAAVRYYMDKADDYRIANDELNHHMRGR